MTGDFQELADLWARRTRLSREEWARLYLLVNHVLTVNPVSQERAPALGGPAAVDHLRQSFFVDKVLLPATVPDADPNPNLTLRALPVFYRRYLLDQLRANQRHKTEPLPADDDGRMTEHNRFGWLGEIDSDCECLDDLNEVDSCALQDSARRFLLGEQDWVVIYLALHFCHGRERLPLSRIQRQYRIASYHYKARELGIAPPRGGYTSLSQFADTLIGRWLTGNDIALEENNLSVIRHAFDLLCMEAFSECDRRELSEQAAEP